MNNLAKIAFCGAATGLLLLSGCSSEKKVDKDDVAKQISTQLESQVGQAPEKVECPEDLKAEKDATLTCTLTDGSDSYGVKVTVTSVDGDNVKFDIKVDDQPK